jgi:hypothetical protein
MTSGVPVTMAWCILRLQMEEWTPIWKAAANILNKLSQTANNVLRKIYGPTQDNDGAWRIKTNEELENLIKKKNIVKIYKITKITLGSTCNQNGYNRNCKKIK